MEEEVSAMEMYVSKDGRSSLRLLACCGSYLSLLSKVFRFLSVLSIIDSLLHFTELRICRIC